MVDQREEWLARPFSVLDDVDVPDLWERIVAHADTEPTVDMLAPRRRRWLPFAAAAALLLVVVGVGVYAFSRPDPDAAEPSTDVVSAGTNTVEIIEGEPGEASVTPTATAGIVTFDITNPTGDNRSVEIRRMLPGMTLDDVRNNVEQFVRTGSSDVIAVDDPPVLGVVHGPDDHFTTTMPLAAGEYAVTINVHDQVLAPVPGHVPAVALLTVEPGDVGDLPTPTLRFDRQATDYLIGDNLATAGPATIHVDNTVGGDFVVSVVELRADATQHDFALFVNSIPPGETADWTSAPAASYRFFYAGAADQTVGVDLEGGDLRVDARPTFDEGGGFATVWVTVE
jgi:hypothetical protein